VSGAHHLENCRTKKREHGKKSRRRTTENSVYYCSGNSDDLAKWGPYQVADEELWEITREGN